MTVTHGSQQQTPVSTDFRFAGNVVQPETIELSVVLPCLNEAETLEICIRKAQRSLAELGVEAKSSSPTTDRPTVRRRSRRPRVPGWSRSPVVATARRSAAASRPHTADTCSWPMPTTATPSTTWAPSSPHCGQAPSWSWATASTAASPRRDAVPAPLRRQPASSPGPAVASSTCRSVTSTAECARSTGRPSCRWACRQTGWSSPARRSSAARWPASGSPRCPRRCARTAAADRRTCARGLMAGGTCGSCWPSVPGGSSSIRRS